MTDEEIARAAKDELGIDGKWFAAQVLRLLAEKRELQLGLDKLLRQLIGRDREIEALEHRLAELRAERRRAVTEDK